MLVFIKLSIYVCVMKKQLSLLLFVIAILFTCSVKAQVADTTVKPLTISGAVDVYYGYDFSEPADRNRLYTTQAYRHNEFNLNWAYIQADYATERVRGTLALQTGTYVQSNYAAEPNDLVRLIGQANLGVKLRDGIWVDMGILPSHIGYESTFSGANEIYTRSLMAENSPYFETGVRLTTELSEKISMRFLVLNGWQNIVETNNSKSVGFGITYTPVESITLSYNNYYGNEAPDEAKTSRRFFHNAYASVLFTERFSLAGSVDYGTQDDRQWYAGMVIAKLQISPQVAVASRVEHYNDTNQVVVVTDTPNGFQTSSLSLNIDYAPAENFLFRVEARGYDSEDQVFSGDDRNALLVTSFSFKF
jgi:hypothetical protein